MASAVALFLARVDHKPAITAQTLMEAEQREALPHSDKPRDSQGIRGWPAAREEGIEGQV